METMNWQPVEAKQHSNHNDHDQNATSFVQLIANVTLWLV